MRKRLTIASVVIGLTFSGAVLNTSSAAARTYWNFRTDINCPAWTVNNPYAGYAMVGATARVACVRQYLALTSNAAALIINVNRPEAYGTLRLWLNHGGGHYSKEGTTTFGLDNCWSRDGVNARPKNPPMNIQIVWNEYLCDANDAYHFPSGDVLVHTKTFPPHGCYHAELTVKSGSETLLDDANSDERCF